jgi:hypothetical protein
MTRTKKSRVERAPGFCGGSDRLGLRFGGERRVYTIDVKCRQDHRPPQPIPVFALVHGLSRIKRSRGRDQAPCTLTIALRAETLEAERVMTIGANLAVIREPRLARLTVLTEAANLLRPAFNDCHHRELRSAWPLFVRRVTRLGKTPNLECFQHKEQ